MTTSNFSAATSRFETGKAIRGAVLGHDFVAKVMSGGDGFMTPIQTLVTEWCWGDVWSRPGLDRRTRSLINLAMLTALNRPHEVELHVCGALTNGVTVAEIQEVLVQTAVYCGVPAALDSFRIAHAVLKAKGALPEAAEPELPTTGPDLSVASGEFP